MTTIAKFNPDKPDEFVQLGYRERHELSDEERQAYDEQESLRADWQREQRRAKLKTPLTPLEEQLDAFRNSKECIEKTAPTYREKEIINAFQTTKDRADKVHELASALMAEGFDIEYFSGYNPCHPDWATHAKIMKNGQEVGSFDLWTPGYYRRPEGWAITTNRAQHSDGRYHYKAPVRRFKLVKSAVKHVVATAIPEQDIESELRGVQKNYRGMCDLYQDQEARAYTILNGTTSFRSMMELAIDGNLEGALDILTGEVSEYREMKARAAVNKDKAEAYLKETVHPLEMQAHEQMPDVYPKPYWAD